MIEKEGRLAKVMARLNLKKYLMPKEFKELMNNYYSYKNDNRSVLIEVKKCKSFPKGYIFYLYETKNMWEANAMGMQHLLKLIQKQKGDI